MKSITQKNFKCITLLKLTPFLPVYGSMGKSHHSATVTSQTVQMTCTYKFFSKPTTVLVYFLNEEI